MINATQIRKGMVIKVEGGIYKVLESTHITPGKGQALMQTKLRSLKDQTLLDYRFRSKDKVEQAFFEKIEMEYLYQSGDEYIFMNLENYEQIKLSSDIIGDGVNYLIQCCLLCTNARRQVCWDRASSEDQFKSSQNRALPQGRHTDGQQ